MMLNEPDAIWIGASGKEYAYWSKPIPYTCNPNQDGNYIFTRINNGRWVAIYIGQGDLNDRVNDPEHYTCAISKGATHVHVHLNSRKRDRLFEEDDLLQANPGAYAPIGCNRKVGG